MDSGENQEACLDACCLSLSALRSAEGCQTRDLVGVKVFPYLLMVVLERAGVEPEVEPDYGSELTYWLVSRRSCVATQIPPASSAMGLQPLSGWWGTHAPWHVLPKPDAAPGTVPSCFAELDCCPFKVAWHFEMPFGQIKLYSSRKWICISQIPLILAENSA